MQYMISNTFVKDKRNHQRHETIIVVPRNAKVLLKMHHKPFGSRAPSDRLESL